MDKESETGQSSPQQVTPAQYLYRYCCCWQRVAAADASENEDEHNPSIDYKQCSLSYQFRSSFVLPEFVTTMPQHAQLTSKHRETIRVFSVHHIKDTAHKAFFCFS